MPLNSHAQGPGSRLSAALLAGAFASAGNVAILFAAHRADIATAHGGLLRLTEEVVWALVSAVHVQVSWTKVAITASSPGLELSFHIFTGLTMASLFGLFLDRRLPGAPLIRGITFGIFVWIVNALIVLPAVGEGVAGRHHLDALGIVCFLLAHMTFFVILSTLYARFLRRPTRAL